MVRIRGRFVNEATERFPNGLERRNEILTVHLLCCLTQILLSKTPPPWGFSLRQDARAVDLCLAFPISPSLYWSFASLHAGDSHPQAGWLLGLFPRLAWWCQMTKYGRA